MGEEASTWERMGQEGENGYKAPYSTADSGISNQEEARGAAAASRSMQAAEVGSNTGFTALARVMKIIEDDKVDQMMDLMKKGF